MPGSGSRLHPLTPNRKFARVCHYVISQSPGAAGRYVLCSPGMSSLASSTASTTSFAGVVQLAGFTAQHAEHDTGNGPGVLWSVGSRNYMVIDVLATSVPAALALLMPAFTGTKS